MGDVININKFAQDTARENANGRLSDWLRDIADYLEDDMIGCNPKSIIIEFIGDDFDEVIYNGRIPEVPRDDVLRASRAITKYLSTGKRDNRDDQNNK